MKARTKGSILVASVIVALIGSGAAVSRGGGDEQWRKALEARSEAHSNGLGNMVLAAAPMLRFLGETAAAERLESAMSTVLAEATFNPELTGRVPADRARVDQMADAIIGRL